MDDYGNKISLIDGIWNEACWNARCDWYVDGCRWDGYCIDDYFLGQAPIYRQLIIPEN